MDPSLLLLARSRLAPFAGRATLIKGDLRQDWSRTLGTFHGVVSATALHWLSQEQLAALYQEIMNLLEPGGIFITPITCPVIIHSSKAPGRINARAPWPESATPTVGRSSGKDIRKPWDRI